MTEEQIKARQQILHTIRNCRDDEQVIEACISYFKSGHTEGYRKGVKATMIAIKDQIDAIVAKLEEAPAGTGGSNG